MKPPIKSLRLVMGDQLSENISSLSGMDTTHDVILMVELMEEATYVRHHPKKIIFILSAMRHFAANLEAQGYTVDYVKIDNSENTGSFAGEVERAVAKWQPDNLIVTEPGEYRVRNVVEQSKHRWDVPIDIRVDNRFIATIDEFSDWASERKSLRMEYFYRDMRKKTGFLMESAQKPAGGQWNYDSDNRKRLPKGLTLPSRPPFKTDTITQEVIDIVRCRFSSHFGAIDGFDYAVSSEDAQQVFDDFVRNALPFFGAYQDAMAVDEPFLFHSLISAYLNVGLLDPTNVCRKAEEAWRKGVAPLNAVEGFIRQIIGWREYVRGLYWTYMPNYAETNALSADCPLPDFYWTGQTDLNCLSQVISQTREFAYAHHIQRLMVTGNFALLIGANPSAVNQWYLEVYVDAFEWVQLPNTHGMALFADGGVMASKPYAASGKYIDRMSDYCKTCRYDPKKTNGEDDACPFNYLYWNFLMRNADVLKDNPRLRMPYRNLERMPEDKKKSIRDATSTFMKSICGN